MFRFWIRCRGDGPPSGPFSFLARLWDFVVPTGFSSPQLGYHPLRHSECSPRGKEFKNDLLFLRSTDRGAFTSNRGVLGEGLATVYNNRKTFPQP